MEANKVDTTIQSLEQSQQFIGMFRSIINAFPTDISKTHTDPLAKVMRYELKRRGVKSLKVVYSKEEPIKLNVTNEERVPGSISFVPSVAGLIITAEVVKDLIRVKGK